MKKNLKTLLILLVLALSAVLPSACDGSNPTDSVQIIPIKMTVAEWEICKADFEAGKEYAQPNIHALNKCAQATYAQSKTDDWYVLFLVDKEK